MRQATTTPYPAQPDETQLLEPRATRHAARRLVRPIAQRVVRFTTLPRAGAGELLAELESLPEVQTVYVTDVRPPSWREWALAGLPAGWELGPSYFEAATPIVRFEHASGRRLEVHHAVSWFGMVPSSPETAAMAFELLARGLAVQFTAAPTDRRRGREPVPPTLLATPATTGRELWLRTIPAGRELPALDTATQQLLRHTLGQGRIEGPETLLAAEPDLEELPGLFEYDGRFMYAALCWGLPRGVPVHDRRDELEEYAQGRYRVRVTVPHHWRYPFGLLGVKAAGGRWEYPAEPGRTFETWCDGAEARLAAREGWRLDILERLLFPKLAGAGPLDLWARKLADVRHACRPAQFPNRPPEVLELVRGALRTIVLTTIGAFQGRPHTVTRTAPVDRAPADMPFDRARLEGDHWIWPEETATKWPALAHPEWCAAVWARARARLLEGPGRTGALHLAPGSRLVGLRTDAIYTDREQPWPDDGGNGRYRLVRRSTDAVRVPRTSTELVNLRNTLPKLGGA